MSNLVIASTNGKPHIHIDHVCEPRREPRLQHIHEIVELTDEEATLPLAELRKRWVHGSLFYKPRKAAA